MDGFMFEDDIWITNPHFDETGRFKFDTENDAAIYYGFPEGFHDLWEATKVLTAEQVAKNFGMESNDDFMTALKDVMGEEE